jgi:hypothetical protein
VSSPAPLLGIAAVYAACGAFLSYPAPPTHVELAGAIVSARHTGAPAWFSGIDERGVARFGCLDAHLGEPERGAGRTPSTLTGDAWTVGA